MKPNVKICGITRADDALLAESLGADAVGFIFCRESPRYIKPESARDISGRLGPYIARVGVFVDDSPETILRTVHEAGLTAVQLHGDEPPGIVEHLGGIPVVKAFRVGPDFDPGRLASYRVHAFLLDTFDKARHGGTGKTFDWSVAGKCRKYGRIILAGGLGPDNIRDAVTSVIPWGVDISSGVEKAPGVKDHQKLRQLFDTIDGMQS